MSMVGKEFGNVLTREIHQLASEKDLNPNVIMEEINSVRSMDDVKNIIKTTFGDELKIVL
jgi:hypothetical protein